MQSRDFSRKKEHLPSRYLYGLGSACSRMAIAKRARAELSLHVTETASAL